MLLRGKMRPAVGTSVSGLAGLCSVATRLEGGCWLLAVGGTRSVPWEQGYLGSTWRFAVKIVSKESIAVEWVS